MISSQPWFALAVKPRHEKLVAQCLRYQQIEDFLPLYVERRRWSDRMKSLALPLFPGYVFCRCEYERRLSVLNTPGVNSFVGFGRTPAVVAPEEIAAIQAMLESGLPAGPGAYVRIGQRVRIEGGPLAGLDGILVREKDSLRVVVNVELLQRSVYVEVSRETISAASAGADHAPCSMRSVA